jgi:SAM-dependent methyltransferase
MKILIKKAIKGINIKFANLSIATARGLNRLGVFDFYQAIPELNIEAKTLVQRASLIKWDAIEKNLPNDNIKMSVLDVGCNIGLYSIKMAMKGHFVTALDGLWYYCEFCRFAANILNLDNIVIGHVKITPENVNILPNYDCVFLMNIFHHICLEYGKDAAMLILHRIFIKTNRVLFFETEQSDTQIEKYAKVLPDMGMSPKYWLIDIFSDMGAREVKDIAFNNGRYLMAIYK